MTAGILIDADHGDQYSVPDSSCWGVSHGMEMTWGWFFVLGCSTDPVVPGTVITVTSREDFPTPVFQATVASITATPPESTSSMPDPGTASELWGVAFCSVIGLYLLSLKIGTVLRLIRNH